MQWKYLIHFALVIAQCEKYFLSHDKNIVENARGQPEMIRLFLTR